jgi:hypothetical protein
MAHYHSHVTLRFSIAVASLGLFATLVAGCAGGALTTREKDAGIGALGGAAVGGRATPTKGDLMVVSINVTTGKIVKVKGVEQAKVAEMNAALDAHGFDAYIEKNYNEIEKELSKPADSPILLLHTHSSPGCEWVLQDGWWRKVCN